MQVYKKNMSAYSNYLKVIAFTFCLLSGLTCVGQYAKQVKAIVKDAEKLEKNGGPISLITDKYVLAAELKPEDSELNFKAGTLLLSTTNRHRALRYLQRVQERDAKFHELLPYYVGLAYKHNGSWDQAIEAFSKIKDETGQIPFQVLREIDECRQGSVQEQLPVSYRIWNAGTGINSPFPDYAPSVDAEGNMMVFTSRRFGDNQSEELFGDGLPFEDIYVSTLTDSGEWQKAVNMKSPVNSSSHDSNLALSPDGNTMLTYTGLNEGDILISRRNAKGQWSRPAAMKWINSRYAEKSACFGRSEKEIFFSSDRPGSRGGLDIYYVYQNDRGYWERPMNLGELINTEGIEDAPFFDPRAGTLYYSSDGLVGIGGFDIWQSSYDSLNNTWSSPENLGMPINSTADDLYFATDTKRVYFTSDRGDGLGDTDIYTGIKLNVPNTEPSKDLISIVVMDIRDSSRIDSEIAVMSKSTNTYLHAERKGVGLYQLAATKDSLLLSFESDNFIYLIEEDQMVDKALKEVYLTPISTNNDEFFTLEHVFFDFNSAVLKPQSFFEIEKLEYFLKTNPTIGIHLVGHTDEVGEDSYNMKLSAARAMSVAEALVLRGIDSYRITTEGQGERNPISSDNPDRNRRVEFTVQVLDEFN